MSSKKWFLEPAVQLAMSFQERHWINVFSRQQRRWTDKMKQLYLPYASVPVNEARNAY